MSFASPEDAETSEAGEKQPRSGGQRDGGRDLAAISTINTLYPRRIGEQSDEGHARVVSCVGATYDSEHTLHLIWVGRRSVPLPLAG